MNRSGSVDDSILVDLYFADVPIAFRIVGFDHSRTAVARVVALVDIVPGHGVLQKWIATLGTGRLTTMYEKTYYNSTEISKQI